MSEQEWKDIEAIEAEVAADLAAIQTDRDAYAFIDKYLSRKMRGQLMAIYQSDRREMGRSPRQAIDNILSLPPL